MCSAALRLRFSEPEMERPFKAGKSTLTLVFITLGPYIISLIMLGSSVATSIYPLIGAVSFYIILSIVYLVIERYRRKKSLLLQTY